MRLPHFTVSVLLSSLPVTAQWAGEWNLNERTGTTAADSSGNGNDGTLRNFSTTTNPWVPGKFGNALSFDGTAHVEINSKQHLPVYDALGTPYSIAYWIKAPAQHDKRAYAEGYSQAQTGFGAIITFGSGRNNLNNTDKFQVYIRNDAGTVVCEGYSAATVYDDNWHHVCFVDVAGDITLYVDGVKDTATIAYKAGMAPGEANYGKFTLDQASLGAVWRQTACCQMRGLLDDVRVYDFALTARDIQLMMLGVPKIPCSSSIGKYGVGCGGGLDLDAAGSAALGGTLRLTMSNGTPNAIAQLVVGLPVSPLDLSVIGFPGCTVYPSLTGALRVTVGALNASGGLPPISVQVPNSPALNCVVGVLQAIAISGSRLELSPAVLAHVGK